MTVPAAYNELYLCQIESPFFAHRSSKTFSQLCARPCRCLSNHSNHFILLDSTGPCFHGQSKREEGLPPRLPHNYRCTAVENAAGGLLGTEKLRLDSTAGWGWEQGQNRQPNQIDPPDKSRPFTCSALLMTKRLFSFPYTHTCLNFFWHQHHLKLEPSHVCCSWLDFGSITTFNGQFLKCALCFQHVAHEAVCWG